MASEDIPRRRVLSASGAVAAGGLAGCSDLFGSSNTEPSGEQPTAGNGVGALASLPVDVLLTFDDGIVDVSGNDRAVAVEGGELVDGRSGQALRLRPPDEYLTVQSGLESPGFDNGAEAQPFSYAAWVQIHSERRHEFFTNEGSRRRLAINADREVCGRMWGGRSDIEGAPACGGRVPLDEWVHIGFVFTGTEGRVYYNGEEIARNPWQGYTGTAKTCSGSRAEGGGDCEAAPGVIDATIDEWAIVRTAISASTMRTLAST